MNKVDNLALGWLLILFGFFAGAVPGIFFWKEDWLGGYGSWRRRLMRLSHISFFGLGFINVIFALTIKSLCPSEKSILLNWASLFVALGAVSMPLVCYLSAWKIRFRQLFPIPVICMILGVAALILSGVMR